MLLVAQAHAQAVSPNDAAENLAYFEAAKQGAAGCAPRQPRAKQQWQTWANQHFGVYTASVESIMTLGEQQGLDKAGQLYLLSELSAKISRDVTLSQKRKRAPCGSFGEWLEQLASHFKQ